MHDGRPLGAPSRTWCTVYLEPQVLSSLRSAPPPGDLAITRPVLADPGTLAELAALAGMSRFQLLRRFAAEYGCTPHAWLTQQRAERARALVRQGLTLAEAADACGFADHMTRTFTRHFGFTPGDWQRAQARVQ